MIDLDCKTGNVFLASGLESVSSEADQAHHSRVAVGFAEHLLAEEDCWGDFIPLLNLSGYQPHSCRCNKPGTDGIRKPHPQPAPCIWATPRAHGVGLNLVAESGKGTEGSVGAGLPTTSPEKAPCNLPSTCCCPAVSQHTKLPRSCSGKEKRASLASAVPSCCLLPVLDPGSFLQLKSKLAH